MRNRRPISEEELFKPLTIPFMIRYLWQIGYIGRKEGKTVIVPLNDDMTLKITMSKNILSFSLSSNIKGNDYDVELACSNATMTTTKMAKIFLEPIGNGGSNIHFVIDAFCETRSDFTRIFNSIYFALLCAHKAYMKTRREIQRDNFFASMLTFVERNHAERVVS